MTRNEMIDQILRLAVNGVVNGKSRTKKELVELIQESMPYSAQDQYLMLTIDLPDGRWRFTIHRWVQSGPRTEACKNCRFFEYDYDIPDTREDEEALVSWYLNMSAC